ncbi:hypothetical protein GIB67_032342 [Kingdonia uniflora]|uniref:BED-type domain-containing protein n=1 Tax=Kingdonia uniflora TaxID=39325 RepID=A0A7J7MXA0_9MAGN|nr:hypothetical protein GIB67_032342 [Kingdonia uniflora]
MEKFLLRDLSSEESFIQIRQRSADETPVLHQIHDPQIGEMVVQQGEQNTPAESQDTNFNSNVPLSPKGSKEKESGTKRKYASIVWDHFTIVEGTRKVPIRAECNYCKTGLKCKHKDVGDWVFKDFACELVVFFLIKARRRRMKFNSHFVFSVS